MDKGEGGHRLQFEAAATVQIWDMSQFIGFYVVNITMRLFKTKWSW